MKTNALMLPEHIESQIIEIRGQRVMLDADLADLYGVPTKRLNEQVKRNIERFPPNFMFQLTNQELGVLRSQIATSNPSARMGLRRCPYAFTEHGALQVANVLNSQTAIQMSVLIIETFVRLREVLHSPKRVERELDMIMNVLTNHDEKIQALFLLIGELNTCKAEPKKRPIGFGRDLDE